MEQQNSTKTNNGFNILIIVCLIVLAGVVGWLVYRTEDIADKQNKAAAKVEEQTEADMDTAGWETTIKSGNGGFQMNVPDGWSPLTNALNSDLVIMPGTAQPTVKAGEEVVVEEVEAYGSDSPAVFSVMLVDKGSTAAPRGEASEFTIGKAEDMLVGKKYSYVYPADALEGIGYIRFQGDRDYEYVFEVNNKELHVYYSVFGSDPRNLSTTVDEIVRTITVATNQSAATR